LYTAATGFSVLSSIFALGSAIYDIFRKRERTWLDYYQVSMALFMFVNVVTKPITLKSVFESEQMKCLAEIDKSLQVIKFINLPAIIRDFTHS
jgi:hypothetical protein